MPKTKEDNALIKHALFCIKELSAVLEMLDKKELEEIKEELRNLSQMIINLYLL